MVWIQRKVRALGLCSGGLDSRLAAEVLRRQHIEVEWISFETPFFSAAKARQAARRHKIPLTVRRITQPYLEMLKNPPGGYGKYMNPCRDCHALMFKFAGEIMREKRFDFLFSGEVLGQRPMSQTRPSLHYVEKHSGCKGYILRPLSAGNLPLTIPEREGKVDRGQLLDITGRSRKTQIKLAETFGITDYPAPAGGCLLTDKRFSARLRDLFTYQKKVAEKDLRLLRFGRHFRLNPAAKIIVGRIHRDNEQIERLYKPSKDTMIQLEIPGPTALLPYASDRESVLLAAGICAGYSKAAPNRSINAVIVAPSGQCIIQVLPTSPAVVRHLLV